MLTGCTDAGEYKIYESEEKRENHGGKRMLQEKKQDEIVIRGYRDAGSGFG